MASRGPIVRLLFSGHALRQMFSRGIVAEDVRAVVDSGEVVASYPDDKPYPSELLLAAPGGHPLHVVLAYNEAEGSGYVVTAYQPDPALWSDDFRTRREP